MDIEPWKKITLLWANLTQEKSDQDALAMFQQKFTIRELNSKDFDLDQVPREEVHGLVLEYDYPDRASLNFLRLTKKNYPSVPLIMLTEQHSEALAVWAFRAKVWDYLVKPLEARQVAALYMELTELHALKSRHEKSPMLHRDNSIPVELRVGTLLDESRLLQRAESYIEDHFASKISLQQMATLCNMSPYRFCRLFKKNYGLTFHEFLLRRRVEEAARLLRNPAALVLDVAYVSGFNDPSYFARVFKRYTGASPGEFRQNRDCKFPEPSPELTI